MDTNRYHYSRAGEKYTACGVLVQRGHVKDELNHVTCQKCIDAESIRRCKERQIQQKAEHKLRVYGKKHGGGYK